MVEIPKEWKPAGAGEEEIDYCLFDLVADTTTPSLTLTFFAHTRAGNTLAVTNLEQAGTLPATQRMLVKGMELLMDVNAPAGVCNLGAVNITKFYKNGIFDFESFKDVIGKSLRFLDCINDITLTPLPEYKEAIIKKRRIGIGIMGI